MKNAENKAGKQLYMEGLKDGIPVAMGYFAVSFTLGITMKNIGMSAVQGFIMSLLNNASAGEYAGITMIASNAPYIETALMILIANARYLLMSCSLSQKLDSTVNTLQRMIIGFDVTDELFALAVSRENKLEPVYFYGAMTLPLAGWSTGTMLGVIAGSALPARIVSALSVALYGMFLAIIIPPARNSRIISVLVLVSFACSFLCGILPGVSSLSEGTRTLILTVLLAGGAAVLFPVKEEAV